MRLDRRGLILGGLASGLTPATGWATVGHPQQLGPIAGFNIRDFGAKGDGQTIDSIAINKAIDAAASQGGGTVYFPAGTYASYTLRLKSRVTLHLGQGAVLLAAPVPEGATSGGYDEPEPMDEAYYRFQDFGHSHWRNSLIWGEGLTDIAIVGDGMIWGKGLTDGHPTEGYKPGDARPGVANKSIGLKNCRNVLLRDFKILQGGWFALLATGVDNLTIDNLLVDTNRDGFDIDCCKNVRVTNCTINSPFDDAIVPKSSYALGYPRTTENVLISNCTLSGNYVIGSVMDGTFKRLKPNETMKIGRIKLGTESNGGFKNITITNCVFDECRGIALETVDGAALEDITISNISMRGCTNAPLFLRLGARMRGPKGVDIGTLKRVLISNINSSGASPLPSIIAGIRGHLIEDIKVADCYFEQLGGGDDALAALLPPENDKRYPETDIFGKQLPATGFFIRHARNVEFSHIEVATRVSDRRPAYWLDTVEDFRGFGLTHPTHDGVAQFRLANVTGFRTLAGERGYDLTFGTPVTRTF
ncbi:MAG: glycoside hydrolase family 28 protein [Asticcacaulis sp.]